MAPFRFALQVSQAASPDAWKALARKTEDLGYSTLYVPDHFGDQWAPMIALTLAAEATTTLKVGTLVLDNDFRHPVVLAMEAATLDVVSGGRFEFGLGAGWMTTDYQQSGIPMEKPSVRIAKMAESLKIMRSMWTTGRATLAGEYYNVTEAIGTPNPVTPGGPPIVIGGGSKRILTLAGQQADIVSVVPSLAAGVIGPDMAAGAVIEKYAERVAWAREAAGARADQLEFQCWTAVVQVVPNAAELLINLAPAFGLTPEQLAAAPLGLIGTTDEIIEVLQQRREELGFSYIVLHEGEMEALAPVIAKLAGT
jgi:probable F420-dependent oxidoreductase